MLERRRVQALNRFSTSPRRDGVALYRWDERQRVLVPLAHAGPLLEEKELPVVHPGQGLVGAVLLARRPILLDGEYAASPYMTAWARDYGVRGEYAVPLLSRGRMLGVLSVMYGHARTVDPGVLPAIERAAKRLAATLGVVRPLAEAERSVAESMTLAKLMRETAAHVDVNAVCARVTETACRLTGADYGLVGVLEEGGAASYGVWGMRSTQCKSAPSRHIFAGLPAEDRGRTLVIAHLPERPDAARAEFVDSLSEGARTLLVAPLGEGSERLGSLVLGWRVDVEPTLRQIALAEALARHASAVVLHARAIERIVRQGHEPGAPADLALVFDATLLIRYASPSYRQALGWEPSEMLGRRLFDFIVPDDAPKAEQHIMLSRLEHSGRIAPFSYRVRHGDGSTRVLESRGVNRSEDPVIGGWVLHGRDITGARRSAQANSAADASLSALLDREAIEEALRLAAADAHAHRAGLA